MRIEEIKVGCYYRVNDDVYNVNLFKGDIVKVEETYNNWLCPDTALRVVKQGDTKSWCIDCYDLDELVLNKGVDCHG